MVTPENVVEIIECGQIVLPQRIAIPYPDAFVGMDVVKGQFTFR
jgi:hypothetical protein